MAKVTMDRAAKRLHKINNELLAIQERLRALHADLRATREELANIITLAGPEAWRILAEADGMHPPKREDDDEHEIQ